MTKYNTVERLLPEWVPDAVSDYLAHIEDGLSIRALAQARSTHPSSILRSVRKYEMSRDDPFIDNALRELATPSSAKTTVYKEGQTVMTRDQHSKMGAQLTKDIIESESKRVLRRLCEPNAVLAAAVSMDTAVVVRETDDGESLKTASVDRPIVQALALKEWISCPDSSGRIQRYHITAAGRNALRNLTAQDENKAQGFSSVKLLGDTSAAMSGEGKKNRYYVTESPLIALSRRKDKDGKPFLKTELMTAGERLREDYELARMGASFEATWEGITALEGRHSEAAPKGVPSGALSALNRVRDAIVDLGPGLGDIALRCCCLLEGLEITEKDLGWSARSGKIVLRIALQRLQRHYEQASGKYGPKIG